MPANVEIITSGYSESEADLALRDTFDFMEERKLLSIKELEGEVEKTDQQKKLLKELISWVNQDLESLGARTRLDDNPNYIHILPEKYFRLKMPDKGTKAYYDTYDDTVVVNEETGNPLKFATSLLHELIHKASTKTILIEKQDSGLYLTATSIGYEIYQARTNRHLFLATNEIITDQNALFMSHKHLGRLNDKEIYEKYGITQEHKDSYQQAYAMYIPLHSAIFRKISQNDPQIWNKLKKGLYSGDHSQLLPIEQAFGPGSLKKLANIDPPRKVNKTLRDIYEYFGADPSILTDEELSKINSHSIDQKSDSQ